MNIPESGRGEGSPAIADEEDGERALEDVEMAVD